MIAVDTSSLVAYLSGSEGSDVDTVDVALEHAHIVLPPVVVAEIFSDPALPEAVSELVLEIPRLEILPGYWERAGKLRALVASKGRKARLADSLIAQSCLDHEVTLVTRDADFEAFKRWAGLKLR